MNDLTLILTRLISGYILLIILMKFMGKREIGQLTLFDLIILLTIVDIMVVGIENYTTNIWFSVLPMVLLALMQKLIAYISLKLVKFRKLVDGNEVLIINKGVVNIEIMRKNRYNMDDLYAQLREKGYLSINEVSYAVLENSGKLSVFGLDMMDSFPLPLVTSGVLNEDNIKDAKLKVEDVLKFIKKCGYDNEKNIYGLNYIDGKMIIVEANKKVYNNKTNK